MKKRLNRINRVRTGHGDKGFSNLTSGDCGKGYKGSEVANFYNKVAILRNLIGKYVDLVSNKKDRKLLKRIREEAIRRILNETYFSFASVTVGLDDFFFEIEERVLKNSEDFFSDDWVIKESKKFVNLERVNLAARETEVAFWSMIQERESSEQTDSIGRLLNILSDYLFLLAAR